MLRQLAINNLAVIDNLNIDFHSGMTVLTGETGAGKSILLDALGLILGNRSDTNLIRGGKDKTDITAVFSVSETNPVLKQLIKLELVSDHKDELFIRRTISKDGRSRAYINNSLVPVQLLKEIGENLIDIHGQHAHQSLSRTKTQRELLDQFGSYQALLNELKKTYQDYTQVCEQLEQFDVAGEAFTAKLSLLRYQIEELTQTNIGEKEYATLTQEHKQQQHSQRLSACCQAAIFDLFEADNAINDRLVTHQKELAELSQIDAELENISTLLNNAAIQLEEAKHDLKYYFTNLDVDNERLATIENRLDKLHELARKHDVAPESLAEHLISLSTQLKQIESGQEEHEALQKKKVELTESYFKLADKLTKERLSVAKEISNAVTQKMNDLAITGQFQIKLEKREDTIPHQDGMDKIAFLVSTNPGQPLRSITKVASGGELSRLSLAIQIINTKDNGVPTMIFDEVDAGISGGIAEVVGELLRSLAEHRQVLCVTHLAQVASCGHHHLKINKMTDANETFTQIETLTHSARVSEIARLLAGKEITDESLANATQMLKLT